MFGQYHVHEIPLVAAVDSGEEGQSPYGARHMAGNIAEWVQDWLGFDYYAVTPDRNPPGPTSGRYKVARGGSLPIPVSAGFSQSVGCWARRGNPTQRVIAIPTQNTGRDTAIPFR